MNFNPQNPEPGIYDMPIQFYHGPEMAHIVSHSYLSRLASAPAKAKTSTEVSQAMIFGRCFHKFALEGAAEFFNECAVMPDFPDTREKKTSGWKNTTEYKALKEIFYKENPGREIVSNEDFKTIQAMTNAMKLNPVVEALLKDGYKEMSYIWQDDETGIWCKARPDGVSDKTLSIVDLKKVSEGMSSEHAFQTIVAKRTYQVQMAMCLHGINTVNKILGNDDEYDIATLIAVEDKPPYITEDWTLDGDFVQHGYDEFKRLLRIEKACREQNFWPNYRPTNLLNLRYKKPGEMLKPGYLSIETRPWETTPEEER
jgi:hypothetical protein